MPGAPCGPGLLVVELAGGLGSRGDATGRQMQPSEKMIPWPKDQAGAVVPSVMARAKWRSSCCWRTACCRLVKALSVPLMQSRAVRGRE